MNFALPGSIVSLVLILFAAILAVFITSLLTRKNNVNLDA